MRIALKEFLMKRNYTPCRSFHRRLAEFQIWFSVDGEVGRSRDKRICCRIAIPFILLATLLRMMLEGPRILLECLRLLLFCQRLARVAQIRLAHFGAIQMSQNQTQNGPFRMPEDDWVPQTQYAGTQGWPAGSQIWPGSQDGCSIL